MTTDIAQARLFLKKAEGYSSEQYLAQAQVHALLAIAEALNALSVQT